MPDSTTNDSPRLRFAPSPTGFMHLGNARTALFNWLYARHTGGEFLLRIEDTDRERHTEDAVEAIYDSLRWMGLDWDGDVTFQSTRFEVYRSFADVLLEKGLAYRCNLTREELDAKRDEIRDAKGMDRPTRKNRNANLGPDCGEHVIRFKTPLDGESRFEDIIQGTIVKHQEELDDFILLRSDGTPTYQFAVVVDDHEMDITHVCRGVDHIDNTHDQINLYKAFGWQPPRFAHAPRILGLSKRKGSPSVEYYREELGLLREGLVNYLARLGWSHGDQEIFTVSELIELFDLDDVNRPNGEFDDDKLAWVNQQHMQKVTTESLLEQARPWFEKRGVDIDPGPWLEDTGCELDAETWREQVLEVTRPRAANLEELVASSRFFFVDPDGFAEKAAKKHLRLKAIDVLEALATKLGALENWTRDTIMTAYRGLCDEMDLGLGKVAQPARVALTGDSRSPGIDDTTFLVGRARAVERIGRAVDWIRKNRG